MCNQDEYDLTQIKEDRENNKVMKRWLPLPLKCAISSKIKKKIQVDQEAKTFESISKTGDKWMGWIKCHTMRKLGTGVAFTNYMGFMISST